jgi:peptide/nickel transport system permease protein
VLAYALRRITYTVPVLLGVATLVFALIHLVPGDPAEAMLGDTASPADLADLPRGKAILGRARRGPP